MILINTVFFIIIFSISLGFIKNRISRAALSFYMLWWFFLLTISLFNPYELYPVSNKTYTLIMLNIFMYFLGYISVCYKKSKTNFCINLNTAHLRKYLMWAQICIFPILLYYYIRYQSLLNSLGFLYARTIKFDLGYLFNSSFEYILYTFIVQPVVDISIIIFCIKLIIGDFKNKLFVFTGINIILNAQTGLGRFVYFQALIYLISSYIIIRKSNGVENFSNGKYKKPKKQKKITVYFASLLMVNVMVIVTLLRQGAKQLTLEMLSSTYLDLFEQAIVYFIGPFRALDTLIQGNTASNNLFFGRLTLGGLDQLLGYLLMIIDSSFQTVNAIVGPMTRSSIPIGQGQQFNAFYTSLLNHYLDFNIVGIMLFPLIYGIISAYIANVFSNNSKATMFMLLLFNTYNSIASSLRWEYQFPGAWVVVVLLLILNIKNPEKNTI